MSENIQNNFYYEICVISKTGSIIKEYITALPIIRSNGLVQDKLISIMKEQHGNDIFVLFNKSQGRMPADNRPIIDIEIPQEPKLNYNK